MKPALLQRGFTLIEVLVAVGIVGVTCWLDFRPAAP